MDARAFPTLTICGLDELDRHGARGVTHVLSILDPGWPAPATFSAFDAHSHITLRFDDAIEPGDRIVLPQLADVEAILTFGRELRGDCGHLLIHCHAGVSRSTAATTMILAQASPRESEDAIVERLVRIRPQAWPNLRMIAFADERLVRGGRLIAAVAKIYAQQLAARPELADAMRLGQRGREVDLGLAAQKLM